MTFGRLTVLEYVGKDKSNKYTEWLCKCQCGNEKVILGKNLLNHATQSCGCLNNEIITKHGLTRVGHIHPLFNTWYNMISRCYHSYEASYKIYGGRGIEVCDRWRNSFVNFLEDMGDKPSPNTSIDRIDGNGNYEPSNCRWATAKQQQNNLRSNRLITYNGETKNLTQWAESIGITCACLSERFKRGWSLEKSLKTPLDTTRKRRNA